MSNAAKTAVICAIFLSSFAFAGEERTSRACLAAWGRGVSASADEAAKASKPLIDEMRRSAAVRYLHDDDVGRQTSSGMFRLKKNETSPERRAAADKIFASVINVRRAWGESFVSAMGRRGADAPCDPSAPGFRAAAEWINDSMIRAASSSRAAESKAIKSDAGLIRSAADGVSSWRMAVLLSGLSRELGPGGTRARTFRAVGAQAESVSAGF